MSIPGVKCPSCKSIQCTIKASRPGRVQFKCQKCKTVFWRTMELPAEIKKPGKGKKKPAKKQPAKKRPTKKKASRIEVEDYDGSTPMINTKHEMYVQILLTQGESMHQAEAYILAGYAPKSADVAKVNASRLLTDANVQARLNWLKAQSAGEGIATRTEALKMLSGIMTTPASELVKKEPVTGLLYFDFGDIQIPLDKDCGISDAVALQKVVIAAADRMAKMQGWDKAEKHEHNIVGLADVFKRTAERGLGLPTEDDFNDAGEE